MSFFIEQLSRGGAFMLPLLFSLPVCLVLFILRIVKCRKQDLPGIGMLLVSSIVAIGLTGALMGEFPMLDAVANSSDEHKESMFEAGRSISIIPLRFALVIASIVAAGFGTVRLMVRHLDLPSPKGAVATRMVGYSSALMAFAGVGLYFYIRNWWLEFSETTGFAMFDAASAAPTVFTLMYVAVVLALLALLLGALGTIASLVIGFSRHHAPTESLET